MGKMFLLKALGGLKPSAAKKLKKLICLWLSGTDFKGIDESAAPDTSDLQEQICVFMQRATVPSSYKLLKHHLLS